MKKEEGNGPFLKKNGCRKIKWDKKVYRVIKWSKIAYREIKESKKAYKERKKKDGKRGEDRKR